MVVVRRKGRGDFEVVGICQCGDELRTSLFDDGGRIGEALDVSCWECGQVGRVGEACWRDLQETIANLKDGEEVRFDVR